MRLYTYSGTVTLVVLFKCLRLLCGPLACCFVQALKVVLMLVVLFKQLRLLCEPLACCLVQALKVVSEHLESRERRGDGLCFSLVHFENKYKGNFESN